MSPYVGSDQKIRLHNNFSFYRYRITSSIILTFQRKIKNPVSIFPTMYSLSFIMNFSLKFTSFVV